MFMQIKCPFCGSENITFGIFFNGFYNCKCCKCNKFFTYVFDNKTYLIDL